jgi:electron transfer flavoprotein alpha subunit
MVDNKSVKREHHFGNAKELLRMRKEMVTATSVTHHSPLEQAKVVIAGGYGMGSRENFELLYRLAELLHGEVGATRAAVNAGFCDASLMIGITGVTVHPELYVAVGISGDSQHLSGVKGAKSLFSINCDAQAPINLIADGVIVGDAREVVLNLIDQLSNVNNPTERVYEQFL